jgi:hypothetical protein
LGLVTATALVGSYWALLACSAVITRAAKAANAWRAGTPARSFRKTSILKQLAQDLEDMASALGPCIQAEPAVVRPRHLARQGEVSAADPPHSRDGLRRGATWAGRGDGGAGAGAAGDAVDARGLEGFRESHRRQAGREPPRQPRLPRPEKATEQAMMVRTPAFASVSPLPRREPTSAFKRNQIDHLLQRVRWILYW